jgi:hypothetical protein
MNDAHFRFEQGGSTLDAGTGFGDVRIYAADGLSGLNFDFPVKSNPQTPNAIVGNKRPLPREITFIARCPKLFRRTLISFFNPYEKGRLTVTWNEVTRRIDYYSHPIIVTQKTVYRDLDVEIKLLCPEPFWRDTDDFGKDIAALRPLIAFPFVMLADRGHIADYRLFSTDVALKNPGDVETGLKVVFRASGNVVNPRITLVGGAFMRAVINMSAGDELIFNTDIDDTYVTLNGGDILNLTDPEQEFFLLPKGESAVSFGADDGSSNLRVIIYFTPQYLGI